MSPVATAEDWRVLSPFASVGWAISSRDGTWYADRHIRNGSHTIVAHSASELAAKLTAAAEA